MLVQPGNPLGYTLARGLVRYKGRLVVRDDQSLKERIFKALHCSPLGGHFGVWVTYEKVKQLFFYLGQKKDVVQFVLSCPIYQQFKQEQVSYPRLLQPLAILEQPWDGISMDFVEGLPRSKGKDVILVIVDRLTKFGHFISLTHPFIALEVA